MICKYSGCRRIRSYQNERAAQWATQPNLLCELTDAEILDGRSGSNDGLRVEASRLVEQQEDVTVHGTKGVTQRHEGCIAHELTDEDPIPLAVSVVGIQTMLPWCFLTTLGLGSEYP